MKHDLDFARPRLCDDSNKVGKHTSIHFCRHEVVSKGDRSGSPSSWRHE